jgi:hypothetical protein
VAAFARMLDGGTDTSACKQAEYQHDEQCFLHNDARFAAAVICARADTKQPAGAAEDYSTIN